MRGKIKKLFRPYADRRLKAIAVLARSESDFRHVDGKNQIFIAAFQRPVYQVESDFLGLANVKLEPGIGTGAFARGLYITGSHGRQA